MQINIKFELKPKQRPKLADEIATALHTIPRYRGVPSLAYEIGDCILERDGTLRIPDSVDRDTVSNLLRHLKEKGFTGETEQTEDRLAVISVPRDTLTQGALENLAKLVENKGALMARAFQVDEIRLTVTEDTVSFPWFPFAAGADETAAYTQFVEKLCGMAKSVKRVSGKPTETDNDKYAFRCFLLRLGFIGDEYRATRKILLKHLSGNSAFRHGK
jgi:hypothetical protein